MIIWMRSFVFSFLDPLIIPGSSIGMIKFKVTFQIGSKDGGYTLAPFHRFFALKSNHLMSILKSMPRVWSLLNVLKLSYSLITFKFHESYVGILFKFIWLIPFFLRIWHMNSKSNSGQTSPHYNKGSLQYSKSFSSSFSSF